MAVVQCKMCGGTVDLPDSVTYAECPYCGSATTFPKLSDDRKESLYNRAENLRRANDFDKALGVYEKILEIDDSDPEIYWGMVLCRYGIEYVEDPVSHDRIPTCHRVQLESILQDSDYRSALEHASGYESAYEAEAHRIAEIQKNILAISSKEEPFDVFICYKETTDAGSRTKDSAIAQDIYYQLTNEGYRVFFARITLEDKLGQEYEPYIFAALNSAKVMLVIGSKKEYFEAVWVKNEWSRFLSLMKKDHSKLLIPCYKDMDAYDIPEEMSMLQSQDMNKIGFIQDLLRGIKKVLVKPAEANNNTANGTGGVDAQIQQLLKKAKIAEELEDYNKLVSIGRQIVELDSNNTEGWYLQANNINNVDTVDKLFEKIINMKPDNASYYIDAAKALYDFVDFEDDLEELNQAYQEHCDFLDNLDEDEEDNDLFDAVLDKLELCADHTDLVEKCLKYLSCVVENKVEGITFSTQYQTEAKEYALELLKDAITTMTELDEEEFYDNYFDEENAKSEKDKLAQMILLQSSYSSEGIDKKLFFNAIASGNLSIIKKYLDDGGSPNIKNEDGYTPLGLAIINSFESIAQILLERGANPNDASGEEKFSPLHLSFYRTADDSPKLIRLLIDHGADPNLQDADGRSALSFAFSLEEIKISPESLTYLLKAGADPNYTVDNYTPLIVVAQIPEKHELLRILLEGGADYMIPSKSCGASAMDYARGKENIGYLNQVECPRFVDFDPIKYDEDLSEKERQNNMRQESPFQIKEFTIGSYIYSEIDCVIRPITFMSDDDKASCPIGASMKVTNTSSSTIKYIHLYLQPVNSVNDPMANVTAFTFTGPLPSGKSESFRIESMDFDNEITDVNCATINDIIVCGAEVEFMNGETMEVSGEAILLDKANISGAQIANGLLEVGKIANGIYNLYKKLMS